MEKKPGIVSKELIQKAANCKSPEELIELAAKENYEITKEEAEAYLNELADMELDDAALERVAGGVCWSNCPTEATCPGHACGTVGWESVKGC